MKKMEYWKNGMMEDRKNGILEEWNDGILGKQRPVKQKKRNGV
jgi:hypothetical protein